MRAAYFLLVLAVASCSSQPSARRLVKVDGPNGEVTCVEPPPDVIGAEFSSQLSAALPGIEDAIRAEMSVQQKAERIREEIPNLQAIEVLDYRLCMAYANGRIEKQLYSQFVEDVLPLLRDSMAVPAK